ncbi:hypothetical protein E2C01_080456 [Portunus trituberculatus]|uniref:Uncharacterized protein n=1 Tax=Portunus trituberculatus TaxID=210409 RepID=A0A5B7ITI4_PORTR|nr:hypothetical protein [Portunus trituberculatus]
MKSVLLFTQQCCHEPPPLPPPGPARIPSARLCGRLPLRRPELRGTQASLPGKSFIYIPRPSLRAKLVQLRQRHTNGRGGDSGASSAARSAATSASLTTDSNAVTPTECTVE